MTDRTSAALQWGLAALIVLALWLAAREYLDANALRAAFAELDVRFAVPLLLLALLYLLANAARFVLALRPLSGASPGMIALGYLAGEAPALLPGGFLVRLALYRQLGVPLAVSGAPLVLLGLLEQGVLLAGSFTAAVWLGTLSPMVALGLLAGVALGTVLGAFVVRARLRAYAAALLDRMGDRLRVGGFTAEFSRAWRTVLQSGLLAPLGLLTVLMYAARVLTVMVCVRAFGERLDVAVALAAFTTPVLLGRFVPVPAGVGVIGAGMTAVLATDGELAVPLAAAAVMVFRLVTVLFTALVSALGFLLFWWLLGRDARRGAG